MKTPIQDQFTKLNISRQRKYQLRKQAAGRCTECGRPSASKSYCVEHLVKAREQARARHGATRRYNTLSYRLAAA